MRIFNNNKKIENDNVGPEGAAALAESLKVNNTLECLDLCIFFRLTNIGNNGIGHDGAKAFADALKVNKILRKLVLSIFVVNTIY